MGKPELLVKARLNLKIDSDLKDWAVEYANKMGMTVTDLIVTYFRFLREESMREDQDLVEQI